MKNKEFLVSILIVCLLFFCGIAYAGANTLTVDEIMDKVEETSPDSTSQKTISEMILIDEDGNEEIRDMLMFSQEGEDEKTSTLVRFLSPKSVEGVTLLNIDDGEKIYLYMPAYNRPRRIAGSSKGDEFMGTGLSYEDMGMNYEDEENKKTLLEETENDYKVEVLPNEEDTSYEKIILHIDKEKFYSKKIKFYETADKLTKILTINKIKIDDKGNITPMEMEFTDMEEEDKTKIVIKEIEYNIELSSSFFSIRTLKKPRL